MCLVLCCTSKTRCGPQVCLLLLWVNLALVTAVCALGGAALLYYREESGIEVDFALGPGDEFVLPFPALFCKDTTFSYTLNTTFHTPNGSFEAPDIVTAEDSETFPGYTQLGSDSFRGYLRLTPAFNWVWVPLRGRGYMTPAYIDGQNANITQQDKHWSINFTLWGSSRLGQDPFFFEYDEYSDLLAIQDSVTPEVDCENVFASGSSRSGRMSSGEALAFSGRGAKNGVVVFCADTSAFVSSYALLDVSMEYRKYLKMGAQGTNYTACGTEYSDSGYCTLGMSLLGFSSPSSYFQGLTMRRETVVQSRGQGVYAWHAQCVPRWELPAAVIVVLLVLIGFGTLLASCCSISDPLMTE